MDIPMLSLITINLNNQTGLEETINCVLNQTYKNLEYIIIDGGSTDGSVDIIKTYEKYIAFWKSEEDKGIYNAMNKGVLEARGEYCLFINSGDIFMRTTALAEMVSYIDGEDILYANGFYKAKNNSLDRLECPEKLTLGFFIIYSLLHPATLIKRELFNRYGLYNESNRIVSDWEFFIKAAIINKATTKLIPLDMVIAEDNGISRKPENADLLANERGNVLKTLFPEYIIDFINEYESLRTDSLRLGYEKQRFSSEIQYYKSNVFFRAILRMMRLLSRVFKKR